MPISKTGNRPSNVSFATRSLANLACDLGCECRVSRACHQLESRTYPVVGKNVQERRLSQGNAKRRLQRVVKYGSPVRLAKIGEDDGVLVGQALALLTRATVKPPCDQQGDQQDGNRNFPELFVCYCHRA
jgi:hypothetical protein